MTSDTTSATRIEPTMNVVRQLIKAMLTSCVPREVLMVRGPRSHAESPKFALTFDDGPHPEYTPRLLDRLEEFGVLATFFVIGRNAAEHPDLIRRMAGAGHEVANHTYSHSEPRLMSSRSFLDEVERTDDLLAELTGRIPSTVRPPKGEVNWGKLRGLWRNRKTIALWNVDPKDFRMTDSREMIQWCGTYKPQDGDIVLLHDNHPYAIHAVQTMSSNGIFERFEATTICQWMAQS